MSRTSAPHQGRVVTDEDIEQAGLSNMRSGKRLLTQRRYEEALWRFKLAQDQFRDDSASEVYYFSGLASLWINDYSEAAQFFSLDTSSRFGASAQVLALWSSMARYHTQAEFLTELGEEYETDAFSYLRQQQQQLQARPEAIILAGIIAYLRGEYYQSIQALKPLVEKPGKLHPWMSTFWAGMALVALEEFRQAKGILEFSLEEAKIPPILMLPLWWHRPKYADFLLTQMARLFAVYNAPFPSFEI